MIGGKDFVLVGIGGDFMGGLLVFEGYVDFL